MINYYYEITEEMKEAMERSRITNKNRYPDIENESHLEGKNNFRAYDQNQSFFITITKDKFLDASHPAASLITLEHMEHYCRFFNYSQSRFH